MATVTIGKTSRSTSRRKRSADLSNVKVQDDFKQIDVQEGVLGNKSSNTTSTLTIQTTSTNKRRRRAPKLVTSESVIYISPISSPSSSNYTTPEKNETQNNEDQLRADEEYARKLQEEYNKSYQEILKIERKDHKIATALQISENAQQMQFQPQQNNGNMISQPISIPSTSLPTQRISTSTKQMNEIPTGIPMQPPAREHSSTKTARVSRKYLQAHSSVPVANKTAMHMPIPNKSVVQIPVYHMSPSISTSSIASIESTNSNNSTPNNFLSVYPPTTLDSINTFEMYIQNGFLNPNIRSNTLISTDSTQQNRLPVPTGIVQNNNLNLIQNTNIPFDNADKFSLLNTYEYQATTGKDADNECTICLEEFQHKTLITHLACMHKFHSICIRLWLNKKDECPLCNKNALTAQ